VAVWACTLGSESGADPARQAELVQKAAAKDSHRGLLPGPLAAALYRAGRFREAAAQLRNALAFPESDTTGLHLLLLAMAQHRLGQTGVAEQTLRQADLWLNRQTEQEKAGKLALDWRRRLEFEILRREAGEVLHAPKPADRTDKPAR